MLKCANQPRAGHHEDKEKPRWVGITVFGETEVVAEETKNTSLPTKETLRGSRGPVTTQALRKESSMAQELPVYVNQFSWLRSCNQCSLGGFLEEAGLGLGTAKSFQWRAEREWGDTREPQGAHTGEATHVTQGILRTPI